MSFGDVFIPDPADYYLSEKGRDELNRLFSAYNEWHENRTDDFKTWGPFSNFWYDSSHPRCFDYADDLFDFLKAYFKRNGYPSLDDKSTKGENNSYFDLNEIRIRKDYSLKHGFLSITTKNDEAVRGLDPWWRIPWPNILDDIKKSFNSAEQVGSPLTLDLDGDGVETLGQDAGVFFDQSQVMCGYRPRQS